METTPDLSTTIHVLGDILGQVISELASPAAFETEERVRNLAKARRAGEAEAGSRLAADVGALDVEAARAVAAAFTIYFDLVNLAEEDYRVATLRQREAEHAAPGAPPMAESIPAALAELAERGVAADQVARLLAGLDIELVLTAHPTEARRRTILSKLQRIAAEVRRLNSPGLLPAEAEAARDAIHAEVAGLWLTRRARTARPNVADEVRTGLFFVDEVLWQALPAIYDALDSALAETYPALAGTLHRPWLHLGSWIGGDRDGNANVTAAITAETLRLHRGLAIERHRAEMQDLARRLSASGQRMPPPPELNEWLAARHPLPAHAAYLERRYADEPYRLALALLASDLAEASTDDMTARLLSDAPHAALVQIHDLTRPLDLLDRSLPAIVTRPLGRLCRRLEIFGLHAARLDIREASDRLNATVAELLRGLNVELDYESRSAAERRAIVARLLEEPAPELSSHAGVTAATAETWALFKLIGRARCVYGPDLLGPFIVSMTHDAADLLAVLLLAHWNGCAEELQIVPLFETRADLQAAPGILADLFAVPAYSRHLKRTGNEQMVMVGYSDSNKDAGYLAANWALYQGKEAIARVCVEQGIRLTLFHGRGGTVARGGGPANRAILAEPPGTVAGRFRLTEQGEIIAARYSNPVLAQRHLHQVVSAVLLASVPEAEPALPAAWRAALDRLAEMAWHSYRGLVYDTPGFLDFWQEATPIDQIAHLQIGSRPAARQAGGLDLGKVRAIPWVFSWMQTRYNLPAWFGLGSALAAPARERRAVPLPLLAEMYHRWPFFRGLIDNAEMALVKADMEIAQLYAGLVSDRALAQRIDGQIRAEYAATQAALLEISGHQRLLDGDPVIQRSVDLRNPYIDPLNYLQVDALRRLRRLEAAGHGASPDAEALREVVVLTINGIAAGLRNTG